MLGSLCVGFCFQSCPFQFVFEPLELQYTWKVPTVAAFVAAVRAVQPNSRYTLPAV